MTYALSIGSRMLTIYSRPPTGGVCQIMIATGAFAAAEQSIGRLIETATRIHAPFWQTAGHFLAGQSMIEQGEFARGVLMLRDAFDVCRRGG